MKSKKTFKILSVLMVLSLVLVILSVIGNRNLSVSAENDTVTYLDFEDGKIPFYNGKNGTDQTNLSVATLADGNKVLKLSGTDNSWAGSGVAPFSGNSRRAMAYGLLNGKGWDSATRPTRVSFRFKSTEAAKFAFHPLFDNSQAVQIYPYFAMQFQANGGKLYINTHYANMNTTDAATINGDTSITANKFSHTGSKIDANDYWNTLVCDYDWSNFNAANGYELSVSVTVTDYTGAELQYENTVKWNNSVNVNTSRVDSIVDFSENQSFSFGIRCEPGANTADEACIDDLLVWSYKVDAANPTDQTVDNAPEPIVKALGTTMAVEETENKDINLKLGFDLTLATKVTEYSGDSIKYYGALVVAGTKDAATMRSELTNALSSGASSGFILTKKDTAEVIMPDLYKVTVTNSGDAAYMGKRLSAIGYIVTESGKVYYSVNNNDLNGISGGVINKSSVGLIKDVFINTYLPAAEADNTALTAAIASYNSANGTAYTLNEVKTLVTSDTVTNTAQRNLLKGLHFLLNE